MFEHFRISGRHWLRLAGLAALVSGVMLGGVGAAAAAESPTGAWQLSLHSDRHSDALPLRQLGSDAWQMGLAPRGGRNLAYLDDELRLARNPIDGAGWSLALLARSSATLVASDDALALSAQVARGQRPMGDARWQAAVRLRAFAGIGAELGRRQALAPQWTTRWSAQGLLLTRWRERQLDGPVGYDAASGTYNFALRSSELHDRLRFPFRDSFAAHGAGLLLGVEMAWQGERGSVALALRDGGWLRWNGVPQRQMQLDTSTQTVDADGFLIYQPLIQGHNSQADTTRAEPWRANAKVGWRLTGAGHIDVSVEHLPGFGALPAVQWQQRSGTVDWGLGWRLHERRASVSAAWQGWRVRAGADRLGASARSREFGLSYALLR